MWVGVVHYKGGSLDGEWAAYSSKSGSQLDALDCAKGGVEDECGVKGLSWVAHQPSGHYTCEVEVDIVARIDIVWVSCK